MKKYSLLTAALLTSQLCFAGDSVDNSMLRDETAVINYSVGYQVGGDFKRQNVKMDEKALLKGIEDALNNGRPQISNEKMRATLISLKKRILTSQYQERQQKQQRFRDEGLSFLKENGQKQDVTTLASGLQYKVLRSGKGKIPKQQDTVSVHYRGTLIDGTEFDKSMTKDKPAQFRVDKVIPGWTEALQLMKEGDKWKIFLPPTLAYGERGPLADRTLVFDVELVKVN